MLFAIATTPASLIVARILMGLGTSCYLMAPLTLYARRFPPERFAMLAGLQLGLGSIGTLLATAPLAFAAATIGWRAAFVADRRRDGARRRADRRDRHRAGRHQAAGGSIAKRCATASTASARRCATDSVGRLFLMHMATYSSFVLIVGLWGGPYLTHVYGYGLTERGALLLIPAVTQIVGLLIFGSADRLFGSYKAPVLIGGVLTVALLAGLAAARNAAAVAPDRLARRVRALHRLHVRS